MNIPSSIKYRLSEKIPTVLSGHSSALMVALTFVMMSVRFEHLLKPQFILFVKREQNEPFIHLHQTFTACYL